MEHKYKHKEYISDDDSEEFHQKKRVYCNLMNLCIVLCGIIFVSIILLTIITLLILDNYGVI